MRRTFAVLFVLLAVTLTAGIAGADDNSGGIRTKQAAMLRVASGGSVTPIITAGETVKGVRFESLPDGISVYPRGQGAVDVYVNHETSTVPFPYTPGAGAANNQNDFDNAQVSRWRLNQKSGGVLNASWAITSDLNFQRFCSNYLATAKEGFSRPILFTNEEATDFVNRTGQAWPPVAPTEPPAQQAGVVVAHDIQSGQTRAIMGMGRHNHENDVAIPGYGHPVVLSGDDTFTSNPAQSQLYSYNAANADAVWNDQGTLYGFKSDNGAVDDYYDFPIGSSMSVSGEFVEIPRAAAVGTQSQLETASDTAHVFQFVRLEDIAYDKRPGMQNIVYIADTGRGTAGSGPSGGNPFTSSNGRVWKMVLDPLNPRKVLSLSVLIEGDDAPVKTLDEIHQPDNLETTANGLFVTEDPGSSQQFPAGSDNPASPNFDARATTGRVWRYDLAAGTKAPVMWVDQAADEGSTDVDPQAKGNLGAWEATGVIDVSSIFGAGAFLVNVQAHTLWTEMQLAPDWTNKREGGQLLLVRLGAGA
jgi:hypothetical protein